MEVWKYNKREKDHNSLIKILGNRNIEGNEVSFIEVINVFIGDDLIDIDFMPFDSSVLKDDLLLKIRDENTTIENLDEKIEEWLHQKGGVWQVSIKDAIDITEDTILSQNQEL